MRQSLKTQWEALRKLHGNENGAEAGLERILLVAFIALPLLGLLIYYKGQVVTFVSSAWTEVTGQGPTNYTSGPTGN